MCSLVLFGASKLGSLAYQFIGDRENIVGFIDNDPQKWGTTFLDLPVYPPMELLNNEYKIIIASSYKDEIIIQLEEMDIFSYSIFEISYQNLNSTNRMKMNKTNLKYEDTFLFYYRDNIIKFYLPNLRDYLQKKIYDNSNFYENVMLEDIRNRVKDSSEIIDIGANIGNHTIFFSSVCQCKVHAFEPQTSVFNHLKKNVQLNNQGNRVELYNIALGEKEDKGNIKIVDKNNLGSSEVEYNNNGEVTINTLDSFISLFKNIAIIKIDVEGMELSVLKGAFKTIKKFKPLLYIETKTQEEFEIIENFLSPLGYEVNQRFNATPTILFLPIN
ncbi:FkbM family methyltransferase [Psychrobacillus sp.]|uniref:FkbM family methyltransferase n=1 Tax=Psychrobacillus sp. TaxID=1871623 RepID=UPI0028BE406F|nr:FkbM family methyltransferase [Psychrobacillus sp.]